MALTNGTVIDRITRVGDVGEPGYSAYGQSLRSCTYSGSKDDWHGATQDALSSLLPTCYITESVYSYLTEGEIESVRSRIQGIVPNSYAHKVYGGIDSFNKSYYCWEFKDGIEARPMPSLDPCAGVTCEPDCFGTSNKYETVCEEGICKLGVMIEENSPDCPGYTPPDPFVCNDGELRGGTVCSDGSIIYTEICQNNDWVATGDKCPKPEPDPEPEPEPEPDTKWDMIILAIVIGILFYFLATRS